MNPIVSAALCMLCNYLHIDTSNPHPNYDLAMELFETQARTDGFETQRILLDSGKPVLVVTMLGSDSTLPAVALNHHMDVVPATEEGWVKPPFAGMMHDDLIIGRGTQDMKGVGIVHYASLVNFKKAYGVPRRTVYLILVPDEEIGGFSGTGMFVKMDVFKALNIGYVLDEGLSSGDNNSLLIKITDRKPMQIVVTGKGTMAHGSLLMAHNINHDMAQFIARLAVLQHEQQKQTYHTPAGLLLSLNVTSIAAGVFNGEAVAFNVIPETVRATIDVRVPPTMMMHNAQKIIDEVIKQFPALTYSVHAQVEDYDQSLEYYTDFYKAVEQAITMQGMKAQPCFFEAASDLRFYKALGIQGFGLTPFTAPDNLHGINESIKVSDVERGINIVTQFLEIFCR